MSIFRLHFKDGHTEDIKSAGGVYDALNRVGYPISLLKELTKWENLNHEKEMLFQNEKIKMIVAPYCALHENNRMAVDVRLLSTGEDIRVELPYSHTEQSEEKGFAEILNSLYFADNCKCGNKRLRSTIGSELSQTNREKLCEICFLKMMDKELKEIEEEEKQAIIKQDAKMKAKGFTHRVTGWMHKSGDDQCVDIYYSQEPTPALIKKAFRTSRIKDDYRIFVL